MTARHKPRRFGYSPDTSAAEAEHLRRVSAQKDVFQYGDLKAAMDFAENLRDCAIRGINEANADIRNAETKEDSDFASYERSFWQGVDAACTAVRRGTTISR